MESETSTQLAVACTLTDAAFRERRDAVQRELFSGQIESSTETDGYRFRFPAGDTWLNRITEFVRAERQCCPFLTFRIKIPAGEQWIELRLSGPPGSAAFIEETFLVQARTS